MWQAASTNVAHTHSARNTHPTRPSALRSPAWRRRCAPAASCCGTPWRGGGGGGGAGSVERRAKAAGGERGAHALWSGVACFFSFTSSVAQTPRPPSYPLQTHTHTHTTRPPPNIMPPPTATAASLALTALLLAAPAASAPPRGSIAPPVPATPVTPETGLVRAYGADGGASVPPPPSCASEAECVKACDGGADWTRGGEGRPPTATMAAEASIRRGMWEERGGRRCAGWRSAAVATLDRRMRKKRVGLPKKTTLHHSSWPAPTPCARRPPSLPSF